MKLGRYLVGLASAEYCSDNECFFELKLQYRITMSCLNPVDNFWYPVEFAEDGTTIHQYGGGLYQTNYTTDPDVDVPEFKPWLYKDHVFDEAECIYGDGYKTSIITINDQSPGPLLEVNEGALVHVTVDNDLMGGSAATLHFHGFTVSFLK